jgi:hypothetical protein
MVAISEKCPCKSYFCAGPYADTWWETVFSGFLMQTILAAIVFAAKCIVFKSFDRWLAAGVAALTAVSVAISLGARTQIWDQFATFLLQL